MPEEEPIDNFERFEHALMPNFSEDMIDPEDDNEIEPLIPQGFHLIEEQEIFLPYGKKIKGRKYKQKQKHVEMS